MVAVACADVPRHARARGAVPPMTRVVLAEDEVLLREGLVGLLTRFDFEVLAAVGSAPALLDAVRAHEPCTAWPRATRSRSWACTPDTRSTRAVVDNAAAGPASLMRGLRPDAGRLVPPRLGRPGVRRGVPARDAVAVSPLVALHIPPFS
jgi:hypothetical protein